MNKQQLLKTLEESHDALLGALGDFDDKKMETLPVDGSWTGKDLLAHITRWENVCADYLAGLARGEPIPRLADSTDKLNADWNAEDRKLTLGEVWENSDASALRVRAMVESLEDPQLQQEMRGPWLEIEEPLPLYRIIGIDTYDHYAQHLKDVQAERGAQGTEGR